MASFISEICIDCSDPAVVSAFWSEVLGWDLQSDDDGSFWMSESGRDDVGDLVLIFDAVPEPKSVKNRVHLDLSPRGCDQATELERLRELGARPVDVGQGEQTWIVLTDPEGNEFCLLAQRRD